MGESTAGNRAFQGLALVFVLTFLNLVGVILTATALGGIDPWSRWQFVGMFGALEAGSGLANVISPNVWRLPVAELRTARRARVKLAASVLLLPHWGGLARFAAGAVCLGLAGWHEGVGLVTLGLVPFLAAIAWLVLGLSAILARVGVAWPDIDVVQVVVRWRRRENEITPVSLTASALQLLLAIATIPLVKLLPPSVLYQPELGPSPAALLWAAVASLAVLALVHLLWSSRIAWAAAAEQQREAEEGG